MDSTIGESSGNNRSHANAMGQEDSAARGTGGNNRNDVDAMSVKVNFVSLPPDFCLSRDL